MFTWTLTFFARMEHYVLLVLFTRPLVLGLYIVVNLCFTTRRANKFFTTSFKNWGPLLETILSGVPNWIKICSYKNRVTFCFIENFKVCTSVNFVKYIMATTMNQCPFLVTSNGLIKSIPHFSKGPKGGMGCKSPLIVDLCAYTWHTSQLLQ
jgi:hypothetical protein